MAGVVVPISDNNLRSKNIGIDMLSALVADDMWRVNQLILTRAGSDVQMIPEIARHLIDSGGKRLRPMLAIATAQMCGYQGEKHILLAAAVEFMHTATLLHDDVVDESNMRRGKKAARMLWGNQASVLVGDFLLGQAFRMMVDADSMAALDVLSHAATVIAEGEVMQLSTAKNLDTNEDEYLAVIRAKTAALFAAAAEIGPIISESDKATIAGFRSYGANLGLAFQLIDDALDYGGSSASLGKNTGDDFREGKVTLPVVLCYRRGTQTERQFWHNALAEGKNDDKMLGQAIQLMKKYDAINDTIVRARHYAEMARDALAPARTGNHKKALIDVLEFCISRAS
jgi:octaprenyl-diphosphate synthase